MSAAQYFYSDIKSTELTVDPRELCARLKAENGFKNNILERCRKRLFKEMTCAYSAVRTDVVYTGENKLDLGFGEIESGDLCRVLSGVKEAFIFAVTLGHGADLLINRLAVMSPAEYFITDALASAYAEAAADFAENALKSGLLCTPRFSPGYGDLPLSVQAGVLSSVRADRTLGITLSAAMLMSPKKSITAIMGIKA